jgi:hypothetical protein
MRDVLSLLRQGNTAQLEKLEANEDKRGFESIDLDWAWKRLNEEMHELDVELHGTKIRSPEDIRLEAADISNFAHMIIVRCDQLIKNPE